MFFPKVILLSLVFSISIARLDLLAQVRRYNTSEEEDLDSGLELKNQKKGKNDSDGCDARCSRPMSDSDTCKKSESSVGCINYSRCLKKCRQESNSKKQTLDKNTKNKKNLKNEDDEE